MTSKVTTLRDAVRELVQPQIHLHLAYGGGRPNAAIAEIIRQFAGTHPAFRVSAHGFVNTQHALLSAGLVDRLTVAYAGENYPSPRPNPALQRALRDGAVAIENWSLWTLTARLIAGALGVPYLPVRSLGGSSMATANAGNGYLEVPDPADGQAVSAVEALRPDIVLVQGLVADPAGNVVLAPPYGEGVWGAYAASGGVIACVERIVDDGYIRSHNTFPMIPSHLVRAVCEVPLGSHPYGIYNAGLEAVGSYVEDGPFMSEFRDAARSPDTLSAWTESWITGVADHDEYLAHLGTERVLALRGRARSAGVATVNVELAARSENPSLPSTEERMILAASRVISARVKERSHNVVLAGIGQAHLAAWIAVSALKDRGHDVELAAELGMSGFIPQGGDPYLFASQNFPTCRQLTDVMGVLGRDVSGPATSAIGVLGAGQIDRAGNVNSTYADNGDFVVGSGGANDVASAAGEVIVVVGHSPTRLVERVGYITAPGRNVTTVVTSLAVLERRDGQFVATSYLTPEPVEREAILREIQAETGWELAIDPQCAPEPPPSPDDLARLRAFDPERLFTGRVR